MLDMIRSRRSSEKKEERYDLFSSLLNASEDADINSGETKLKDRELIGFILFILIVSMIGAKYLNYSQYLHLPISWPRGTWYSYIFSRRWRCFVAFWFHIQTTAHTLCFTFGLLALHPEEQETLYQHIKSVIPDDRLPVQSKSFLRIFQWSNT